MNYTQDVITYEDAIVDNTDPNKRKVVLTDKDKPYKQCFYLQHSDAELIRITKQMRELNIKSM